MTGEPLQIRELRPDGVDDVAELWQVLYEHHVAVGTRITEVSVAVDKRQSWQRRSELYRKWLSGPDAFGLVAEQVSRPVGYAMVRVQDGERGAIWEQRGRVAVLESLSVLPSIRGGGVGGALLDAIKRRLLAQAVITLDLDVVASNLAAIRFYERHGFRESITRMTSRIDAAED
ncbi:GNAT family N-acetyltransferase [Micromonospora sp. NPDC047707]|uniref:GNAT family N-acetyltransferase n=1 Tax=Micromonospora sp. NPDC047707 TaxID=3154498 RepID=UPI003452DE55